ncbi:MAG: c-type cytochrome domain-containing protein, partial [Limisphaerales bacterium]
MKWPLLFSLLVLACAGQAAAPSRSEVEPFLRDYCLRCHNAEKKKGDLRLDNLSADFNDLLVAQKWDEVMLRINSGEMPPKDEKQPPAEAVSKVADWITT